MVLLEPGIPTEIESVQPLAAAGDYAAEDVMCRNATTGVAWKFTRIVAGKGGKGVITKAKIIWQTTNLKPRLTLYLFKAIPTSELDDNKVNVAPSFADRSIYIDKIDFAALEDLGGMSGVTATPSTVGNLPLPFECADGDDSIYGILVTRDAITGEAATEELAIRLTVEPA